MSRINSMNKERLELLDKNGGQLTIQEMKDGWHYCPEWDYMLLNYNHKEGETCSCEQWEFSVSDEQS